MNVALVDVDSHNFPNLVLMKVSAWFKRNGDDTFLLRPSDVLNGQNMFENYDQLYGACVFSGHEEIVDALEKIGATVGGTGTKHCYMNLPPEEEITLFGTKRKYPEEKKIRWERSYK